MLKRLVLSASALAFAGGVAFAQTQMPENPSRMPQNPSITGQTAMPKPPSTSMARRLASDIYKANVYDGSENKIGDVNDLVLNSNGEITTAIIGVGGFLGAGEKDVSVPFKDLKFSSRDGKEWVVLRRTKDSLKAAPAYEPTGRSAASSASSLSTANWLVSDIYSANVYNNADEKIGDINDLVIDSDGIIMKAVIGVGGFLGAGQKDVAVPFNELKVTSRDGKEWLMLNRTKDDLKTAPAYDKKSEMKKM